MSILSLSLLGPFQAELGGKPLGKFRTKKVQALLIYLATEAPLTNRREALMALLWPGLPQKSAQVNLRQVLYQLRRKIPEIASKDGKETVPLFLSDRQTVQLNPAGDIQLDVVRFQELISIEPTPEQLTSAVDLYRDNFICDFFLPDSAEFEGWAATKRTELRRQALDAFDALTDIHIEEGAYDEAQAMAWRGLGIDDLRESAYRGLMIALASAGQRTTALAQYQVCRNRLENELGVEPSVETASLYEQIQTDALRYTRERQPHRISYRAGMPVFLFTDIEGSTSLWEMHREAMLPALLAHNEILEDQIAQHGGRILELRGDGVKAVFEGVDPLPAVLAIQQAFGQQDWGEVGELRIRIGLHGAQQEEEGYEYFLKGDQYYGPALHHGARIMNCGHGGQILVSEVVRDSFTLPPDATWQTFGEHALDGMEDTKLIYGLLHPDLQLQTFPPLRTPSVSAEVLEQPIQPPLVSAEHEIPRHNLSLQPTPFIGREAELNELNDLISDPNVRMINIMGPGGMGKTRLALAVAEGQLTATTSTNGKEIPRFPDGVYFVPLAALEEADAILSMVAKSVGFQFYEDVDSGKQLLDYFRQKTTMLVMDNFEHLKEKAKVLSEILETAPGVKILVTSRDKLSLRGENVFSLWGLRYPDETALEGGTYLQDVGQYSAVELFLNCAQRVCSGFELRPSDIEPVISICRLVGGMPLGIELAASLVEMLSSEEIAKEIKTDLDILEAERQDAPERHQNIRVLIDQTWNVLGEQERVVFKKLSVFRGGFTRVSAQYVANASLRQIQILLNKSLIRWNREGRYEILALLRQYGAEKLAEDPADETMAHDRHSAYYCGLLQHHQTDILYARKQKVMAEFENDSENIRIAWSWAVTQMQLERIAQSMDSLSYFYWWRGHYRDGEKAARLTVDTLTEDELIERHSVEAQLLLANALAWQSHFYTILGRIELAEQSLQKGSAILDSPGLADQDMRSEKAFLLEQRGRLAYESGHYEESMQWEEQCLALSRALDDQWGTANVLNRLGWTAWHTGKFHDAKQRFEESLTLHQALGNQWGMATVFRGLGRVARSLLDYEKTIQLFNESLALSRLDGNKIGIIYSLEQLGYLALFQGRFEEGAGLLQQCVDISREIGDRVSIGFGLLLLGVALWLSGKHAQGYSFMEESIRIFNDLEVNFQITLATHYMAVANVHLGKYEEASAQAQMVTRQALGYPYQLGSAQRVLGWVALVEEKYSEAEQWMQESVATFRPIGRQERIAWSLAALSRASYALGNRSEAQLHVYEALEIAVEIGAFIPLLYIIPIVSLLLADQGEVERAIELYSLASQYPFVSQGQLFEDIAGRLITALAASLPSDVIEAAKARGEKREMWDTAAELLKELPKLNWSKPAD